MSINAVADVKPFKTMWKINVKVIRLWKQYSAAGGETIEMVLCDLTGVKIHASVKRELVGQFDQFLRQGYSVVLINFAVTHSCGSYRTTNHPYKISFLAATRVLSGEELPADLTGFEPVKYKEVLDGTLSPDYLVDVMGQIVEISHIEHVNVNGKETEKLSLELRNSDDERLPIVLWGKFACDLSDALQVRDEHLTVLVLRFGKIKVWQDERSISNAYNVSEIGLNLPMIEVGKFIESLPKDDLQGSEDGHDHAMDTQSDSAEVLLAIQGSVSGHSDIPVLTSAKRIRPVNLDFEDSVEENSVIRSVASVIIKKERLAKSG